MNIIQKIRDLKNEDDSYCKVHDITAISLATEVGRLLEAIILDDALEEDRFESWVERVRIQACEMLGGHDWVFDQCGHWGHKYCDNCDSPKYPELCGSDKLPEVKGVTEEEYIKRKV